MEDIIIRQAAETDIEQLLVFEQGVINAERPFDPTLKKGDIHYYDLIEMIRSSTIELVVAELNNEIVGSGYARVEQSKPYLQHERHAYLGFMYVDPKHRGKEINKKIIEALKKWAASQNLKELRLDVYLDNTPAIRAYEKIGFEKHMIEMRLGLDE